MRTSIALVAALALTGCELTEPESAPKTPNAAEQRAALAGAPEPLARMHARSGALLGGGPGAFQRELAGLRGYPVVVNKWASWCGPCRAEFGHLRSVALDRGREVAFVGVDALDSDAAARRFLARNPVPYPHYKDPDQEIAKLFRGNASFPTTAFYDRRGRFVIALQRFYASEAQLLADIDRYTR